jgi:hypothetical protein
VLAAIGLLLTGWWRSSPFPGLALLAFLGVQSLALLSLEFRFQRHLFPILPLLLPWASAGAEWVGSAVSRTAASLARAPFAARGLSWLLCAGLTASLLAVAYPATLQVGELGQARERHLQQAGEWIEVHSGRDRPRVAAYSTVIVYYADGTQTYLPYAPETLALEYLHEHKPDFIAVRSEDVRQTPYAAEWLQRGIPDRCAVPGTTLLAGGSTVVRIWRWQCKD